MNDASSLCLIADVSRIDHVSCKEGAMLTSLLIVEVLDSIDLGRVCVPSNSSKFLQFLLDSLPPLLDFHEGWDFLKIQLWFSLRL